MIKRLVKIFSVLLILALIVAGFFTYGMYVSVKQVQTNYQTITSPKIPEDLNNTRIAYISDFKLNEYMNFERLSGMFDQLKKTGCDVLIFGGDIFYDANKTPVNEEMSQKMIDLLKSVEAPLGKYAVLGEDDQLNEEVRNSVQNILYQANFEILNNSGIRIRNKTTSSINLIGINSISPNNEQAFSTMNNDEFTILLSHYPDMLDDKEVQSAKVDVAFAGHSLGGQIYVPLIGGVLKLDGANSYYRGKYTVGETALYVSNGLGTQTMDMRILTPPQISMYRLSSK